MALTAKQKAAIELKFGVSAQNTKAGWVQKEDSDGNMQWVNPTLQEKYDKEGNDRRVGSRGTEDTLQNADTEWRSSWLQDHPEIPIASGTNAPFGMNVVGEQRFDPKVEEYWGFTGEDFEKRSMPSGFTRPQFTDPTTGAQIEYTKPNNPDEWSGAYPDYNPFDFMDSYGWLLPLAVAGGGLAYGAYGAGAGAGTGVGQTAIGGTGTAVGSGAVGSGSGAGAFGTGLAAESAYGAGGTALGGLETASGLGGAATAGGVGATTIGTGQFAESAYGAGELAATEAVAETSFWESLLPTQETLMKEAGKTLVSQGISTLLGKKNTPKVGKAPALSPVLGMPLPNSQAVDMARRRSLATQMSRQGRASTMLSGREKLGS